MAGVEVAGGDDVVVGLVVVDVVCPARTVPEAKAKVARMLSVNFILG